MRAWAEESVGPGKAPSADNVGYGPFRIPSQSPLQALRPGYIPRAPSMMEAGDLEVRASLAWVNLWVSRSTCRIDAEMLQTDLSVAHGLGETVGLEAGLELRSRFGGPLDGLIEDFHSLVTGTSDGRGESPRGEFNVTLPGGAATWTGEDVGLYSAALRLDLLHRLTPGTGVAPAVGYVVTVRGELWPQDDFASYNPVDLAVSLAASKRLGDFYVYAGGGLAWFGRERFQDVALDVVQWSVLGAAEWRFAGAASLVIQYLVSSGNAESLGDFSSPAQELLVGVAVGIAADAALDVGLIENVVNRTASPDFGLLAGVRTRF